jgi:hypothetical protein
MWIQKAFLTLISLTLFATAQENKVMIGILEDIPGKHVGGGNTRAIRVVLEKNGSEWRSFPNDCPNLECLKTAVSARDESFLGSSRFRKRLLFFRYGPLLKGLVPSHFLPPAMTV